MPEPVKVRGDVWWIEALDPNLRIFDIEMRTRYGTSYNSYLVRGQQKTAVIEAVKEGFFDEQFLPHLQPLAKPEKIDYIIVDHTEPDHAGSVVRLLELAPQASAIGLRTALRFLRNIVNRDFPSLEVSDADELDLGGYALRFINVPFLHWLDSIFTYLVVGSAHCPLARHWALPLSI